MRKIFLMVIATALLSCQSKESKLDKTETMEKTVDYVFTCNLKDDPELIKQYKAYHSPVGVWPEVTQTLKACGAKSIRIYIYNTSLVLIISLPERISLEEFGRIYASTSPKIKEWDKLMASFQLPPNGGPAGSTWAAMEQMYSFEQ